MLAILFITFTLAFFYNFYFSFLLLNMSNYN